MNYKALKAELGNPQYEEMSDTEVVASLQAPSRTRLRASMSGDEVFAAVDQEALAALPENVQTHVLEFCARDSIDPTSDANVAFVRRVFGQDSTTVANL